MKETEKRRTQEREAYVPADVKVIEIKAQAVICTSIEPLNNGGEY